MQSPPGKVKVFVTRSIPEVGPQLLREAGFEVKTWQEDRPMEPSELLDEARQATALITLFTDRIDGQFLQQAGNLDIISQFAVGYDNIDIQAATDLGIPIGYAPGAMSDATADIAFGLMIAVSRKFFFMHKSIEKGDWTFFRPMANLGFELKNKTLGIVGLGRIGQEMAKRCRGAYDMEVVYHNRRRNDAAAQTIGARWLPFEELLAQSDVVSVHCSLNDSTRGLFDRSAFLKMKRSAIFINTARGAMHNEQDLLHALRTGVIWGAGLDVTNPEPMDPGHPLLRMENVAVLPHIGSATIEARSEMSRLAALNILAFYRGEQVPHLVNREVVKAPGA
ncbi:MAG TPA: D-glycerate dehydrogenase [Chitinophagaceae bacterium]